MKNMKKIVAMALAVVMILSLATTVFADDGQNHTTYIAYQIFEANQTTDVLTDIEWGEGVNADDLLAELNATMDDFEDCETAADVAAVLEGYESKSAKAEAFAKIVYKHVKGTGEAAGATLSAGYYLIVDRTEFNDDDTNTVYNLALLHMTKEGPFTVETKVDYPEVTKKILVGTDVTNKDHLADATNANIGDTITFVLTATMPTTLKGYETYKVIFHDTMSAGLTFKKVESINVEGFTTETSTNEETGITTITITNNDVLDKGVEANDKIIVTYTATLNEDAVVGVKGNPNEVYLEYSNNPNWTAGGATEPTGKTPEDEVIVYTTDLKIIKTNDKNEVLTGAEFNLTNGDDVNINFTVGEDGTYTITGLRAGEYTITETKAPAGYNQLKDSIVVTIGWTAPAEGETECTWTYNGTDKATINDNEVNINQVTVINQAGSTLPETGGIGTTLFYIFGTIMVLGAAVLLITKKRMSIAE